MKVAIIGSRNLDIRIEKYMLPPNITMIISGGAAGVDTEAERYADDHGVPKLIFRPDYEKFGKKAPLIRNMMIVNNADVVVAFWDGESRGTRFTMEYAKEKGKKLYLYNLNKIYRSY